MLALIDGDVVLHSCLWGTKDFTAAAYKIEKVFEEWPLGAFCTDLVVAVGPWDGKNYRDDIYPDYKQTATRVNGRKTRLDHFYETKEFLYSLPYVVVADNEEADDLLGIWSTAVPESVVITSDKDLDQLPGLHWNPGILLKSREPVYYEQSLESANRFFLKQLVMGDAVDKIPGLPGWGEVKAEAFCAKYEDYKSLAEGVLTLYKEELGDNWLNHFLANGKLLYLRRKDGEFFTTELFEQRFK